MTTDIPALAAAALIDYLADFDILLLILARLVACFLVLPMLAGNSIPVMARVMFAFCLSVLVHSTGAIGVVAYEPNMIGYFTLVFNEIAAGILMGFLVYLAFAIIYLAGQIMDHQIGFAMVNILDPLSSTQVPVIGTLLYFLMMALFVASGGFNYVIFVVSTSFEIANVGQVFLLGNYNLLVYCIGIFANFMVLAVQFSMPIAGAMFVINVMLGVLVKSAPQMNVFVIGMPLKLFLGMLLLWTLIPMFNTYYNTLFEFGYDTLRVAIVGLVR